MAEPRIYRASLRYNFGDIHSAISVHRSNRLRERQMSALASKGDETTRDETAALFQEVTLAS
jgi:hypothetical protein